MLIALGASALTAPLGSFAQQPDKFRRIGFLAARSRPAPSSPDVYYDAFVKGMRDLGYVEGTNLVIEWRYADGKFDRLAGLAAELVRMKPELIVTHSTPATQALQRATSSIPIVVASMGDPLVAGITTSLARPGGNVTGLSLVSPDVYPKQLELLKAVLPKLTRVAALANPGNPIGPVFLKRIQAVAPQLGLTILPVEARTPEEIERGFAAMRRERAGAVVISADTFFIEQHHQIAELVARDRLPSMFYHREPVIAGGLMSYGQNLAEYFRRAATYVHKILKGTKPGDLPIEQPIKIHLAINLKTAKALGIKVSKEMQFRADELIE